MVRKPAFDDLNGIPWIDSNHSFTVQGSQNRMKGSKVKTPDLSAKIYDY